MLSKFQGGYTYFWKNSFDFRCQNVNRLPTELGMIELKLSYSYFLLKVLDLVDTVKQYFVS